MQYCKIIIHFSILIFINLILIDKIHTTPLDDYVKAPDTHFSWNVIQTYQQPDYVLYILNFTSQKWLDGSWLSTYKILSLMYFKTIVETFSNRPIWWHYLCISVPHRITRPNAAFMLIDGGSNRNGYIKKTLDYFVLF